MVSTAPFYTQLSFMVSLVFLSSLIGTFLMRRLSTARGWVVMPRQDRWHKKPTALHGGMGFFPSFVLGGIWVLIGSFPPGDYGWLSAQAVPREFILAAMLLLGSLLMFLFGLWDDLHQIRPATKLLFELSTASLFISAGGIFRLTGVDVLDVLLTYFWFVGIMNAVNMLDNMDGLSSGVVALAGTTLVILALQAHGISVNRVLAIPLGLIFVGSLLGFWFHNRPPAGIFMGDSGSLSIGYVLAALAVPSPLNGFMGIHSEKTILGSLLVLVIPVTVLAIPIFDTTLVTITRKWRAQKASVGGRDHSSHRLVGLGLSEKKAVWVLYAFAAFGGAVAVLVQQFPGRSLPLFGLYVLTLIIAGVYLGHVKIQRLESDQAPPAWTPLVANLLYKRRVAEVMLDTVLIVLCFYGAYLLRFEGKLSSASLAAVLDGFPIVVSACLLANFMGGVYRGQWRLITVSDIPNFAGSVLGGVSASLAVVTLISRFEPGHSRSAYIIFGLLLFVALTGSRLSFRFFDSMLIRMGRDALQIPRKPVLIYGAGKAGKLLHEEAAYNADMTGYAVVGFIDDDPNKHGRRLCGLAIRPAGDWAKKHRDPEEVPQIWISSRFVPDEKAKRSAALFRTPPSIFRLRLQMDAVESTPGGSAVKVSKEEVDIRS